MTMRVRLLKFRRLWLVVLLLGLLPSTASRVRGADARYKLRVASLAPMQSAAGKSFMRWARRIKRNTGGRVRMIPYLGGVSGDEHAVVRKIRAGQLDGGALTAVGLSHVYKPVLSMQVPGLIRNYAQMDAVRDAFTPEFDRAFRERGFEILSWGDAGRVRIFSKEPIRRPSDLRKARPWLWADDSIFPAIIRSAGATGVPLPMPEVSAGLKTGMVDVVSSSAMVVVGLQWFTDLSYMTRQSDSFLVGGLLLRKDVMDTLPEELAAQVRAATRKYAAEERAAVRRSDARSYEALLQHGVKAVDISDQREQWDALAEDVKKRLQGRIYPEQLLQRIERAVQEAK